MSPTTYDLLGIGNAIVDVVVPTPDAFLIQLGMRKGAMALISASEAEALYAAMPPGRESSGGSAANTCAVAAGLGARVAFLGTVAQDQLGLIFQHDIRASGVHFATAPLQGGLPTARCLIAVTPDGQRTMNTFLGACVSFGPDQLDETLIESSAVTYLEGYLFDPPACQAAFRQAAEVAHKAGRLVALSLSDAFCVHRHRAAFLQLVEHGVDILFANEAEIGALYETESFEDAAAQAAQFVSLAALTRGAAGSIILQDGQRVEVKAEPATVVDTTGAGDAYAAGFLAAHARGIDLAGCGRLGSLAAAAAIGQYGARPDVDLRALAGEVG